MADLRGFQQGSFSAHDITHDVYVKGDGPPVLLLHESYGFTPTFLRLADLLTAEGYRIYAPHLFGKLLENGGWGLAARVCFQREINCFLVGEDSKLTPWLRALCHEWLLPRATETGIGVIGMCLTGNFAISLMADPDVVAPVTSQPALPFPSLFRNHDAFTVTKEDLANARRRAQEEGVKLLGLKYEQDRLCPASRFERLQREFGDAFLEYLEPGEGHSVLTREVYGADGEPNEQAISRVVDFFQAQFGTANP